MAHSSHPHRHKPSVAPPPSASLMSLQKIGLELGALASTSSLQLPENHMSARSTPSDLDKPLPLEPPELVRRSSSQYTNGTTITNIINLYESWQEDKRLSEPSIQPQAYRETIAPLLGSRFSFSSSASSSPTEHHSICSSIELSKPPVMKSDSSEAMKLLIDTRVRERRKLIPDEYGNIIPPSPMRSVEYHRRLALERLAPPSPQISPGSRVALSEHGSYLPGPITGTITDVIAPELIPAPLNLGRASKIPYIQDVTYQVHQPPPQNPYEYIQGKTRHSSWSTDSFVIYTGVGEVIKAKIKEKMRKRKESSKKDKQQSAMTDVDKLINMRRDEEVMLMAAHEDHRSSLSKGVSDLVRAFSLSGRKTTKEPQPFQIPRRQKQLAIPITPYQKYGADVWLDKNKKKRRAERRAQQLAMNNDTRTSGLQPPSTV